MSSRSGRASGQRALAKQANRPTVRRCRRLGAAAVVVVSLVAGCGAGDADMSSPPTSPTTDVDVAPDGGTSDRPQDDGGPEAEEVKTVYHGSGDEVSMEVPARWEEVESSGSGDLGWFLEEQVVGEYTSHINLHTFEQFGGDVETVLDGQVTEFTIAFGGSEVLAGEEVDEGRGTSSGFRELRGDLDGTPLHLLVMASVAGERVGVVTLLAGEDEFTEMRREAEPYMQTMRAS